MFKLFSLFFSLVFVFSTTCSSQSIKEAVPVSHSSSDIIIKGNDITVRKKWDAKTQTFYYLTKIKHRNQNGKILKLRQALAYGGGETVLHFAHRMGNPLLAINCSTVFTNKTPTRQENGILIIDGKLIQSRTSSKRFTLGIKANNKLLAYPPGTTAYDIFKDGTKNAVTAFTPLIENYKPVSDSILKTVKHYSSPNPRQVIAQFDNLDLLILSCGGRSYEGKGLTAKDIIRILEGLKREVKFAYNLDGGGSTTTVINGKLITPKIDDHGTKLRLRASFLYIKSNN